jgi:beta-glucosidase
MAARLDLGNVAFSAATAAYQTEGGIVDTNWNRWEELGTRPVDGGETVEHHATAGRATDSWQRFKQDLELMKTLGLHVYRFSVEW